MSNDQNLDSGENLLPTVDEPTTSDNTPEILQPEVAKQLQPSAEASANSADSNTFETHIQAQPTEVNTEKGQIEEASDTSTGSIATTDEANTTADEPKSQLKVKLKNLLQLPGKLIYYIFVGLGALIPARIKNLSRTKKIIFAGSTLTILALLYFFVVMPIVNLALDNLTPPQNHEIEAALQPDIVSASIINEASDIRPTETISITFKQKPDIALLQSNIKINVNGKESSNIASPGLKIEPTSDPNTVNITRESGWEADTVYDLSFASEELPFLERDFSLSFQTIQSPKVVLVNFSKVISPTDPLLISFNSNVFKNERADLDISTIIETTPKIEGTVEILSESTIRLRPNKPLDINTTYKVRIAAERIKNNFGLGMKEDYMSQFKPGEVTQTPYDYTDSPIKYFDGGDIRPNSKDPIKFILDRNVDKSTLKTASKLVRESDKSPFAFTLGFSSPTYKTLKSQGMDVYEYPTPKDDATFTLVTLTPNSNWEANTSYRYVVTTDLKMISGEKSEEEENFYIPVSGPFKFVSSSENNGIFDGKNNYPSNEFKVRFSNNLVYSNEELQKLVTVTAITGRTGNMEKYVQSGYGSYESNELGIQADFKDGNTYKVKISGELTDKFGNHLGSDLEFEFKPLNVSDPSLINIYGKQIAYVDNNDPSYRLLFESMNLNDIQIDIVRITPTDLISFMESNIENQSAIALSRGTVVKSMTKHFDDFDTKDEIKYGLLQFQYPLESIEDGIYVVKAYDQSKKYMDYRILILSKNVTSMKISQNQILAWVANTNTGDGYAGAQLTFTESGKGTASATTDEQGIAKFDYKVTQSGYKPKYIYSNTGDIFVSSSHNDGLQQDIYDYSDYYEGGYTEYDYKVEHIYFDRPVYRAGQDVHFKIFKRDRNTQNHSIDLPNGSQKVKIVDSTDKIIYESELQMSEFGTMNATFNLDKNLNSGIYSVYLKHKDAQEYPYNPIGGFRIASYKVSSYSFKATIDDKETYLPGENVNVNVDAKYYFGEPLKNANVDVNLYIRNSDYSYLNNKLGKEYGQYQFPNAYTYEGDLSYDSLKLTTVSGKTDENGLLTLSVPVNISEKLAYGLAKELSIEVKVTDDTGVEAYQTFYKTLLPKGGTIGIYEHDNYVNIRDTSTFDADILAMNERLEPSAGVSLKAEVIQHENHLVKRRRENGVYYWDTVSQDTKVYETTITTDAKGKATFNYKPTKESSYEVKFSLTSNTNISNTVSFYAYDFDYGGFDYYSGENSRITMRADKDEYNIGDSAVFRPELPGSNYRALVTVETNDILSYKIVDMSKSPSLSVQVSDNLQPNFYYSFLGFTPHNAGGKFLDIKSGLAEGNVSISAREIKTDITTDKEKYFPKDKVNLSVKTNGDKDMEYVVAVVDKAVLDLSKVDQNKDLAAKLVEKFWSDWPTEIRTTSNLTIYENKAIAEKKWGNKGGSGDGGGPGNDFNLQIEDVRRDFKDVALWIPAQVAKGGDFNLEFEVPDNLTTWSVVVIGISKDTYFTAAAKEIIVSNDVNIISGVPSYMTKGDKASLVYSASFAKEFGSLNTQIEVDNGLINCNGEMKNKCNMEFNKEKLPIEYEFVPSGEGISKARFAILEGRQVLDAEEREINIIPDAQQRNDLIFGDTRTSDPVVFAYPQGHEQNPKKLRVVLSADVIGDLGTVKSYFVNYQNQCSEQVSSIILTLLPHIEEPGVRAQIDLAIDRLYLLQNTDGGWGIWEYNDSLMFNSIQAYYALIELQRNGVEIDQSRIDRAEEYIQSKLVEEDTSLYPFAWSVLAESNIYDISGTNAYYEREKGYMNLTDNAYLLSTYNSYLHSENIKSAERPEVTKKIEFLIEQIMLSRKDSLGRTYWQDPKSPHYYDNNVRNTAVILDALLNVEGDDNSLIPVINYLKYEISQGKINDTQSNYRIYRALRNAQRIFKLDIEHSRAQVIVNGVVYKNFKDEGDNKVLEIEIPKDSDRVEMKVESRNNSLIFYQAEFEYSTPFEYVQPEEKGMTIVTEFYDMNDKKLPFDGDSQVFTQSGIYKAKTILFVKEDLAQSEIRIPMPAGIKAIDFSLNNTSNELFENLQAENMNSNLLAHLSINEKDVVFYTGDVEYNAQMKKGVYVFTFLVRANTKGSFKSKGEWMQEMYLPGKGAWQGVRKVKVV